jgi:hypothetical protein
VGYGSQGRLQVIDTSEDTSRTISLGDGFGVDTIAVNPVSGVVYAGSYNYTESNDSQDVYLLVIDPDTDTVTAIETDAFPYDLAVNADGTRLYAAGDTNLNPDGDSYGSVQVFNVATGTVTAIRLPGGVDSFVLGTNGSRGYASTAAYNPATGNYDSYTLSYVDV